MFMKILNKYMTANVFTPLFILVEICRSMGRLASGIPQVPIRSKLYIPSTLIIDLILWHTQMIVCAVKR